MRPAFSVVLLTTLIGVGQGLFLALYGAQVAADLGFAQPPGRGFLVTGVAFSVAFAAAGLFASFFHLGRPERAWRSASRWRTSWLSREVIALPAFMALAAAWGAALHYEWSATAAVGALAAIACLALFACTGMVYACMRFLQEWASGWTVANFTLMGCASGFTFATWLATSDDPERAPAYAAWALALTAVALGGRCVSLARNARIRHRSTLQTAIGIADPKVRQISQGFTGNSFNTIEFFHGVSAARMKKLRFAFLGGAFLVPSAMLGAWLATRAPGLVALAFVTQYGGLLVERWFFLADSSHPQNLYYQSRA